MRGSSNLFLISSISSLKFSTLLFLLQSPSEPCPYSARLCISISGASPPCLSIACSLYSLHLPCYASQFYLNSFPSLFGTLLNFALPVLFLAIGSHATPATILYSLANRVTAVLDLSLPFLFSAYFAIHLHFRSTLILSIPCFSRSPQPLSDPYNAFPFPLQSTFCIAFPFQHRSSPLFSIVFLSVGRTSLSNPLVSDQITNFPFLVTAHQINSQSLPFDAVLILSGPFQFVSYQLV